MRTILAALLLLGACAAPAAHDTPGRWRQEAVQIPIKYADGTPFVLQGRVCRPDGDAPARLVVIAHGSPPIASDRLRTKLTDCDAEAAHWFLARGYVVVVALRRGYGATGGVYVEGAQGCTVEEYARSARESARDLQAMIDFGTALPFVRPDGAVVVGQSAGGWAADGLDSLPHPKVIAIVSMAGGRGGHYHNTPGVNCLPDNLAAAAGVLGHTATTPMLWIYTANDSFFAPSIAAAMHKAFTDAGGKAEFHQLGPYGGDGHQLFFGRGGSEIWGLLIEQYLKQQGAV